MDDTVPLRCEPRGRVQKSAAAPFAAHMSSFPAVRMRFEADVPMNGPVKASFTPLGVSAPPSAAPPAPAAAPELRDVRCACTECGAHVTAWVGHTVSGTCSVCGSYDLRTLD
jgi:hypothetical protein